MKSDLSNYAEFMRAYPCEELSGAITMFPVGHLEDGQMGERINQPENRDCHEKGASAGESSNLCLLDVVGGGKAGSSTKNDAIVGAAQSGLGKELWHKAEGVTGNMGAAAAVSEVLSSAGVMNSPVASVKNMERILRAQHWDQRNLEDRQPGDVMIRTSPGYSNIGIAGPNDSVFVNRRDGRFVQMPLKNSSLREDSIVLHPPEKK